MTTLSEALLRQDLRDLPAYRPSAVTIAEMERVVKLDANENPYGPSPLALKSLADTRVWNRYATQDELRAPIGLYVGVDAANIVVGNGADEIIDLIERVTLAPQDSIVDCPPTFEMYSHYARVIGAHVIEAERRADFSIDLPAIERAVATEQPKIICLANPNNPDGSTAPREVIERLTELPVLVVLDEAYAEFAGESYTQLVPDSTNLIVVRTFSKWAGLAGLRLGYCVAPKFIADQLMKIKSPYNVNSAGIVAAYASLEDIDYLMDNVDRIVQERERLSDALKGISWLEPLPTRANFILCRLRGHSPLRVRSILAEERIYVRAFSSPRLEEYLRISVGRPEQNDALLAALERVGK